ncbi:LPXTG cell wall anchor domain-containing protein [uncultured Sphingomonas sp.]|uniref:LPXTG cell wall anchor domain-containing protein n=1 Tax=uncultured Sphingomonas sp. TaxID=158754 RepID=UPI0035CC51D7
MGRLTRRAVGAAWAAVLVGTAAGAGAQTTPTPLPTAVPSAAPSTGPTATPAPLRIPGLDGFNLPSDRATPAPTPSLTPVPATTPRPVPTAPPHPVPRATASPAPKPRPTPAATPGVTPSPRAEPQPAPQPTASPSTAPLAAPSTAATPIARPTPSAAPVPAPTASATPVLQPAATAAEPDTGVSPWWYVLGGLVVLAAAGYAWSRRRRPPAPPTPRERAVPPVAPPPAGPIAARARLEIELLPRRGGLTLISLVFEGELLVRNTGDATAARVTVEATLIPARSDQDAELGALFARPIARPAAAPFALAPGDERRVRLVAAMPLAGTEPLMAGGRQMIVPVLAANVVYAPAEGAGGGAGEGQTAASWIVGVARPGSDKLVPFWLDAGGLSDTLAIRPHALAVTR